MNVRILRLINNEEIIGKVDLPSGKNGKFKVKNGAVIIPAGEGRIAILPWLPHAKDTEVEIDPSKVVIDFSPLDDLANEYNTKIGNGLVVPTPSFESFDTAGSGLSISGD
tara:strand:+ start:387 stop:716 length:330 start_codon:yes stop_codon:yes gene_type:complete